MFTFVKNIEALTLEERFRLISALRGNNKILEMARNPNNLSLIVKFFLAEKNLPSSLYSLYWWMVERIFERQEFQPSLGDEWQISTTVKIQLISAIAAKMTSVGTLHLSSGSISNEEYDIQDILIEELKSDSQTRSKIPESFAKDPFSLAKVLISKTMFSGDPKVGYSFEHQSFQEFFSSMWLKRFISRLTQSELDTLTMDSNWDEAFVFLSSSLEPSGFAELVNKLSASGDFGVLLSWKMCNTIQE